jgi:putative protease
VVSAYRRVIDGLGGDNEKNIREGLSILRNDFARPKTTFYLDRNPPRAGAGIDWLNPDQNGGTGIALGKLLKVRGGERRGLIAGGAVTPRVGDSVRFHRADDSDRQSHKITLSEQEGPGDPISPKGDAQKRWISIPEGFDVGDSVYLIQTKGMSKRYAPVIPRSPGGAENSRGRMPGRDKAPVITLPPIKKGAFSEGLYAAVSGIEDLYILQSARPLGVMLYYTRRTGTSLLQNKQLPFSPEELILVLDPWFPQDMDPALAEDIPRLLARGYRRFVVNNLGQLSYFRALKAEQNTALIAGPYLYTFNRWAHAFIASLGMDNMVSPLENNRQNLERTIDPGRRSGTFITVFAYPALFRIPSDMGAVYDFRNFSDSRDEQFRLISSSGAVPDRNGGTSSEVSAHPEGSMVIPETPFSIIDKIPFLKKAGFKRFILDLSGPPLRKKDYKDLMAAVKNALPLPHISRFNWKDGFYSHEV